MPLKNCCDSQPVPRLVPGSPVVPLGVPGAGEGPASCTLPSFHFRLPSITHETIGGSGASKGWSAAGRERGHGRGRERERERDQSVWAAEDHFFVPKPLSHGLPADFSGAEGFFATHSTELFQQVRHQTPASAEGERGRRRPAIGWATCGVPSSTLMSSLHIGASETGAPLT